MQKKLEVQVEYGPNLGQRLQELADAYITQLTGKQSQVKPLSPKIKPSAPPKPDLAVTTDLNENGTVKTVTLASGLLSEAQLKEFHASLQDAFYNAPIVRVFLVWPEKVTSQAGPTYDTAPAFVATKAKPKAHEPERGEEPRGKPGPKPKGWKR